MPPDGTPWQSGSDFLDFWMLIYGDSPNHTMVTRPGKRLHNYGKSPFIVDFPMKNGDFP